MKEEQASSEGTVPRFITRSGVQSQAPFKQARHHSTHLALCGRRCQSPMASWAARATAAASGHLASKRSMSLPSIKMAIQDIELAGDSW